MTNSVRIGRRVRAELYEHGISAMAMAERIGLSQSAMSTRISGAVDFRIGELKAIADALGVPVTQLLPQAEPAPGGAR